MDMREKIKIAAEIESRFHAARTLSVKAKRGGAIALVAVSGGAHFFLFDTRNGQASCDTYDRATAELSFKRA